MKVKAVIVNRAHYFLTDPRTDTIQVNAMFVMLYTSGSQPFWAHGSLLFFFNTRWTTLVCSILIPIGADFFLKKENSRGTRIFIRILISMYQVSQKE